jgi:hypothetical protein
MGEVFPFFDPEPMESEMRQGRNRPDARPHSASPQSYGERISNHHHFNVKLKTHEGKTFEVVLHPKSIAEWLVTGNKPILK